jgi:bis(5'-nucleosyl)-tetraphosphatase (symmetrical)
MRWLVGDVQGCAVELSQLLEKIRFDPARDELFCVGDLVNRGLDSLDVLRLWRDVGGRSVLGNHDRYALLARSGRWPRRPDTLDALFAAPDADALLARLRSCPVLVPLPASGAGPDAVVVHAGLHPHWTDLDAVARRVNAEPHDDDWLLTPEVEFATRVRCCTERGDLCEFTGAPQDCPAPHRPWDEFYASDTLVVHGHWARRGHYRSAHVIGLDSGCVYGGALTAWCQDEDRIVQVPSRARV